MTGVAVSGPRAYVGVGGRLEVLDVADPAQPKRIGRSPLLSGRTGTVAVRGDFAFVDTNRAVTVVGLRDPSRPRPAAVIPMDGTVLQLAVLGDTLAALVLYGEEPAGLRLVDIRRPEAPRPAAFIDLKGQVSGL